MKLLVFLQKVILIIIFSGTLFISCENNIDKPVKQENIKIHNINLDPNSTYTMDDVINSYDTTNITGYIQCYNDFSQVFYFDSTNALITENNNKAQAYFFDPNNHDSLYVCSGISINDTLLRAINSNDPFTYIAFGNQNLKNGVYYNFSNPNNIKIIGNQYIPSIDTSITFENPIRILNINRGDTILNTEELNISWTGESDGFAQIMISREDSIGIYGDSTYFGNAIIDNNGSFTISSEIMKQFPQGIYNIIIYKFEPHFILLNNGYKVVLIIQTSHKITVYIT